MKQLLITIAAVVVVGCGESQQSTTAPVVKPVEPVDEAAHPEPSTAKVPDIPIIFAARDGNIEAVKQNLAAGTEADKKDIFQKTALHEAARKGRKEIAELLISKGADMNARDSLTLTPLHYAAVSDHKKIAELLIAKGANINEINKYDRTPLDVAIMKKHTETVNFLRKHGGKTGEELKAAGN